MFGPKGAFLIQTVDPAFLSYPWPADMLPGPEGTAP